MKKLFLLAVIISAIYACSKDDDDEMNYPLNGTEWVCAEYDTINNVAYFDKTTIYFKKETFDMKIVQNETINGKTETTNDGGSGVYSYSHPKITMTANDITENGIFKENFLIIGELIFIKK